MSYDIERYADVLEAMSNDPFWINFPQDGLKSMKDFYEHAVADWHRRRGLRQAAEMLRKTPMALYVTYPDYFPNPEATDDQ